MACVACGSALPTGASFCMTCGCDQTGKKTKLTPLSEEGHAIVAALNLSLGSKIDQVSSDVKVVNSKVDEANTRIDDHEERLSKLESKASQSEVRSTQQRPQVAVPHELRTIAVIGNLGWDTSGTDLMQRAKEVLSDAGIAPDSFSNLCAVTYKGDKGSSAQLCFKQPSQLQHANLAVRALNRSYTQGRYAYLDVKKERAELRPGQIVKRLAEFLVDAEAAMDTPLKIEAFANGKFVKVGGTRVGFTFRGEWKWTQYAIARYSREVMDTAKEYAESE